MFTVFVKRRQLHTPANMLLVALCLSDFLVGLLIHTLFIIVLLIGEFLEPYLIYKTFLHTLSLLDGFSIACLICIALERYVSISCPFWYERNVTCKLNIYAVVLLDMVWFMPLMIFFLDMNTFPYISVIIEDISFLIVLLCYVPIYRTISKQKRGIIVYTTE